jgi:pimeloyl-ACP methyl ester carboxylesterase
MNAARAHLVVFAALLTLGCAGEVVEQAGADLGASEAPLLGAAPLPPEVIRALTRPRDLSEAELDEVHELHHYLPVGPGRRVHVTETFTLRGWLSWPHRAVLLLPGTLSQGSFYNLDVDGYRFQDTLAREGFFAFAVDYEGSGESTYPANGYDVTHDYLVAANRPILSFIRLARLVPKVDVLGESNGGSIATELCADGRAVRSCVLTSMLYVEGTDFFNSVFLDPGFVWFLTNQPDGYLDVGPELYFNILARMSPEVAAATLDTQPGVYAMGPVVVGLSGLPWFDPTRAAVPGLIIQGTEDSIATQADADLLAAAYGSVGGGEATVARIEGAGMIPRTEPAPYNEQWTDLVLEFLDR